MIPLSPTFRVSDGMRELSAAGFDAATQNVAASLVTQLAMPGARIGLWGENSLDYLIALVGVLRAGHVAVPLNTRLAPRELGAMAEATGLSAVLTSEISVPHRQALKRVPVLPLSMEPGGSTTLPARDATQPAVLIGSSGSSGQPKIVPLTLNALVNHAQAVCAHLQFGPEDSWIAALPFYHVGGLAIPFRCFVSGGACNILPHPDPAAINGLIDEGATFVSVVATTLERMRTLRASKPYPQSLRAIIVGGGPVPVELLKRCPQAYGTYGLTEAGSMLTCARPGCDEEERLSAGKPLPHSEVRLEGGELIARGPGMATAYWNDPELSARVFMDGWIRTGDLGYFDKHGNLHVEARREDLILSGGENIYPAEIVAALKTHPQIAEAVVLPIADREWGQIPAAFIALAENTQMSVSQIQAYLAERLARYKIPRRIVIADELPLLPTGKPDLATIRKQLNEN